MQRRPPTKTEFVLPLDVNGPRARVHSQRFCLPLQVQCRSQTGASNSGRWPLSQLPRTNLTAFCAAFPGPSPRGRPDGKLMPSIRARSHQPASLIRSLRFDFLRFTSLGGEHARPQTQGATQPNRLRELRDFVRGVGKRIRGALQQGIAVFCRVGLVFSGTRSAEKPALWLGIATPQSSGDEQGRARRWSRRGRIPLGRT